MMKTHQNWLIGEAYSASTVYWSDAAVDRIERTSYVLNAVQRQAAASGLPSAEWIDADERHEALVDFANELLDYLGLDRADWFDFIMECAGGLAALALHD